MVNYVYRFYHRIRPSRLPQECLRENMFFTQMLEEDFWQRVIIFPQLQSKGKSALAFEHARRKNDWRAETKKNNEKGAHEDANDDTRVDGILYPRSDSRLCHN